jgi:hypothetical protein
MRRVQRFSVETRPQLKIGLLIVMATAGEKRLSVVDEGQAPVADVLEEVDRVGVDVRNDGIADAGAERDRAGTGKDVVETVLSFEMRNDLCSEQQSCSPDREGGSCAGSYP